jgi:hypothetical protein
LGTDVQASLAERCSVKQLTQILYTLVNRINAVEGAKDFGRNKKQRSAPAKKARQEKGSDRRW